MMINDDDDVDDDVDDEPMIRNPLVTSYDIPGIP